ncbi:MAG: VWA domain-containing protein [Candidatus Zixiibacteriota bacterium]|nr:MAG: VWA domain-containing protein [candidate division Zixibacteria bacterium]
MKKTLILMAMIFGIFGTAMADGFIMPRPKPWMPPHPRVNVKYHHVNVRISDPVAITSIDQVFVNPFGRELEADYIFPIPENASVSRFVAWLNGRKMEAELLDAKEARRIYEDIVRQHKDPAILEYAGRGMYRMRIYPIPANGEVRIKLEYEETLKSDYGTVTYLYPLNTEKYSNSNLEECKIEIDVSSFEKIGSVYCPTHNVTSERKGERSMTVSYLERNIRPAEDFILHFTRQKSDFGFHLLSYREPGTKDGYFIGILSPPLENSSRTFDKNLIFILDSSGSMRGEKMQQAKEALEFCLLGLNAGDRFNIIDYDDNVMPYNPGLLDASKKNVADAIEFADRIDASGGTNIYDALARACEMIPKNGDPTYLIFLTDGLPTVGNRNIEDIIKNTTRLNESRARLFVFGVGYDVNAHLLDRLAEENGGAPEYVLPNENIEVKVSRLAARISRPAMTDVKLRFASENGYNIYPEKLPDLFYGSEVIITGRFRSLGGSDATLSGKIADEHAEYRYPVEYSDGSVSDEYIALLWANRRIGHLLQQMRLHGTSDELLTEVIELSKKFGIITEYTSFLVTGDEYRMAGAYWEAEAPVLRKSLKDKLEGLGGEKSGRTAVTQSQSLHSQSVSKQVAPDGMVVIDEQRHEITNAKQVGVQAFYQSGVNWIQSDIEKDSFDIEIKRFSEAYFQLLEKDPSLGRYLAVGDEVRFKVGSQVVQISDSGIEYLSVDELRELFPN